MKKIILILSLLLGGCMHDHDFEYYVVTNITTSNVDDCSITIEGYYGNGQPCHYHDMYYNNGCDTFEIGDTLKLVKR